MKDNNLLISILRFIKNPVWAFKTHQHNIFFPDRFTVKRIYKKTFGVKPNLKNPVRLTEKMQWLKLHDRSSLHTVCADKIEVRDYVTKKIGKEYLIPLFGVYETADELNVESLPNEPFIIKANHDSSGGIIALDKRELDLNEAKESLRKRLKINYYNVSGEWQYKNIPPRILVEKLLLTSKGSIPDDYKIHCFNGRAEFIGVDQKSDESHSRNYYDSSWNPLPFEWPAKKCPRGQNVNKPLLLNELIRLSETLSKDFYYARIDFYIVDDRIFFGEITFHDTGGFGLFSPRIWDEKLGEKLNLT